MSEVSMTDFTFTTVYSKLITFNLTFETPYLDCRLVPPPSPATQLIHRTHNNIINTTLIKPQSFKYDPRLPSFSTTSQLTSITVVSESFHSIDKIICPHQFQIHTIVLIAKFIPIHCLISYVTTFHTIWKVKQDLIVTHIQKRKHINQ